MYFSLAENISFVVLYQTYFSFLLSNRPYLIVENTRGPGEHGPNTINVAVVRFVCFRTPATVFSVNTEFYVHSPRDAGGRVLVKQTSDTSFLVMPTDIHTVLEDTFPGILALAATLKPGEKLRRRIEIKYAWAGNSRRNRVYVFSGVWQLNKEDKAWDIIGQQMT